MCGLCSGVRRVVHVVLSPTGTCVHDARERTRSTPRRVRVQGSAVLFVSSNRRMGPWCATACDASCRRHDTAAGVCDPVYTRAYEVSTRAQDGARSSMSVRTKAPPLCASSYPRIAITRMWHT